MVGMDKTVSAGMVAGVSLNAQATVDAFNNLNNGTGFNFYVSGSQGMDLKIATNWATERPDLGAYVSTGTNHDSFLTFNFGNDLAVNGGKHFGTLSYDNDGTSKTSQAFGINNPRACWY